MTLSRDHFLSQLILGNFGLSGDQERVQMGMWAIMASPLIMSVDLRTIRNSSMALLLNRNVIAINQDPLGVQGQRIKMVMFADFRPCCRAEYTSCCRRPCRYDRFLPPPPHNPLVHGLLLPPSPLQPCNPCDLDVIT